MSCTLEGQGGKEGKKSKSGGTEKGGGVCGGLNSYGPKSLNGWPIGRVRDVGIGR